MRPELMKVLLQKLREPDASSSVLPLIVVLALLCTGLIAVTAYLVSKIKLPRWLRRRGGAPEIAPQEAVVVYLNREGKFRRFFKRLFVFADRALVPSNEEVDELRRKIEELGHALTHERDQNAKALRKITELQGEIQNLETKYRQEAAHAEAEEQRRMKLEEQVARLEAQLLEAAREVERLYQQNAKLDLSRELPKEMAVAVERARREIHPPDSSAKLSEQEQEIQRLKEVLSACRAQMLRMTGGKPFESRITPKK